MSQPRHGPSTRDGSLPASDGAAFEAWPIAAARCSSVTLAPHALAAMASRTKTNANVRRPPSFITSLFDHVREVPARRYVPAVAEEHEGKVVIVTGGSTGVGLGIARAFLDAGASVVTCARTAFDVAPAARTQEERERTLHVAADIREAEQIDAVIGATIERFGRLDVLVNNAGGQPPADIATASPRFIRAIIELNLTAPMIFAAAAYRVMREQDSGGCVINISSQASMPARGSGGSLVPYGAAKAGLNHMTRSLAVAWGRKFE